MKHELKIWPEYYSAVTELKKRFEIRKEDDKTFKEGDEINLREFEPGSQKYSGRRCDVIVRYVMRGPAWDLPLGMAVMSIDLQRTWNGSK